MIGRRRINSAFNEVPQEWQQPNWVNRGTLPITPKMPQGGSMLGDVFSDGPPPGEIGAGGGGPPAWMFSFGGGPGVGIPHGSLGGFGGLGYGAPAMAGLPNRPSDVQSLDDWDEYWKRLQQQRQGGGGSFGLA